MARDLFIDMTNRRLAQSLTSLFPADFPSFVKGDTGQINLYFLQATGNIQTPFTVMDMTGTSVKFGVGTRTGMPRSGTFTLSFGGETSGAIGFSATAGAISSALNSLSAITSIGGVSVDGDVSSNFVINFNSAGTRSAITADVSHLIPTTLALVDERLVGDATTNEIQELQLRLTPAVYQPTWTDFPTAVTVSVSTSITGSASNNEVQRIDFSRTPYNGAYRITVPTYNVDIASTVTDGVFITSENHGLVIAQPVSLTGFTAISGYTQGQQYFVRTTPNSTQFTLSATANGTAITTGSGTVTSGSIATTVLRQTSPISPLFNAPTVQSMLESLDCIGSGQENISVNGIAGSFFSITFQNSKGLRAYPQLQVQSTLQGYPGKYALVNFNTFGVRDYLLNSTSATADLEIELTNGGDRSTIILQQCTLSEELISQTGIV